MLRQRLARVVMAERKVLGDAGSLSGKTFLLRRLLFLTLKS
jgi:hypothetical protein